MPESNFACLASAEPDLATAGQDAEVAFVMDPRAAMGHLRRFGERLAVALLEQHRLPVYDEPQIERLRRLRHDTSLDREHLDDLHTLRKMGNGAVHAFGGDPGHGDAMRMLKAAARLARWYWTDHTARNPPGPGPFVKPTAPDRRREAALARAELEAERRERARSESEVASLLRLLEMPQVATHQGIEQSFHRLTDDQQSRVSAFLQQFRAEPLHADWPMIRADGMHDDKVRFVATGTDDLVITVVAPPRADIVIVVHVGTEAEARAWASGKRFEVNGAIGTLQAFDVAEAEAAAPTGEAARGLLDDVADAALVQVGLPTALIPAVRALATDADLDQLSPHLPPEASDALYLLASGHDLDQTLTLLDRAAPAPVDTEDYAAAVQHPESRRSFVLVDGPEDLDAVLRGSVEAWRLYLHPDQRKLVRMRARGPIRVLGGAGTGKTVALLHRARHLLTSVFVEPTDRLLVTTFTRNLAADLEHQLGRLLDPEDAARVDVTNLHALVHRLWTRHGDGRVVAGKVQRERAWERALTEEALGLGDGFYRAEWEQVVQAAAIADETGYLRARREGRGVTLDRGKRRAVWKVLAAYRAALDAQRLLDPDDPFLQLRQGLDAGTVPRPYVAALVDETQDFGAPELLFLRALVPPGDNDLFFAGDAHQRIYGSPCGCPAAASRSAVAPDGSGELPHHRRSPRLRRRCADRSGVRRSGRGPGHARRLPLDPGRASPEVVLLPTASAERDHVVAQVRRWLDEGVPHEAICVAAPTKQLVNDRASWLDQAKIPATVVDADSADRGRGSASPRSTA
ncbi:MAG: AAA family ATPase [Myxococcota bacterium]